MISKSLFARKTRKPWTGRWVAKAHAIARAVDSLMDQLRTEIGHHDLNSYSDDQRRAARHVVESLGEIRGRVSGIVRDLETLGKGSPYQG